MVKRVSELKVLESEYAKLSSSLVFMYGRKGAGKNELISSFIEGKNVFYYQARQCSDEQQVRFMVKDASAAFGSIISEESYEECFSKIKSGPEKLVIVIDEVQYIAKKSNDFIDAILKLRDGQLYKGKVLIILASSSIVWGERDFPEFMKEKETKASYIMKLSDVSFLDVVRAFPEYSVAQCVSTYGILGGVPTYLNRWDGKKSIKTNIINNILDPNGYLYGEAENFIHTELRELSVYDTILGSIADGNVKLNELFEDTGYARAKLIVYMKNLGAFDVVEKVNSFETGGWENTKKGVYKISAPFVHFWFTFIYPNLSDLNMLSPEDFYAKHIEKQLDGYLQNYFSNVCREYLELLNRVGQTPIKLTSFGTWIGKESTIDIVGQSSIRENVVGICNWNERIMSYEAYEELVETMRKARITAKTIYLFSATAFDPKLVQLSNIDKSVVLVDMKEL